MDSLFDLLSSVSNDLESIGARWALIGGLAVGVRTEPRFTRPGFSAPVATPGHLIAMKILARNDKDRPQDRLDLKALLRISDSTELKRAEVALASIVEAGFHRGRDLKVEFLEAQSELL